MAGIRPTYTISEQRKILRYMVDKKLLYVIQADKFWKDMAAEKTVHRTWESGREHFRKKLFYMLRDPRLRITSQEIESIKKGCISPSKQGYPHEPETPVDITDIVYHTDDDEEDEDEDCIITGDNSTEKPPESSKSTTT